MKNYSRPVVEVMPEMAEGVYTDTSGDVTTDGSVESGSTTTTHPKKCRHGRTEANRGSDTCQHCSISGGVLTTGPSGIGKEDYKGCVDSMPEK